MLPSLVSLLVLGGAVAGAGAAATGHAPQAIVCPLQANGHATTCCGPPVQGQPCCPATGTATEPAQPICCGPPEPPPGAGTEPAQPICCPPNADCAAGLTIGSSPDPSTAGHQVTISGELLGASGATPVALWQQLPSGSVEQVGQTTTNSSGQYTFLRDPEVNREWYVTASSMRSTTIDQSVRAAVTVTASGLHAHGHITPSHAGERIWFEQRTTRGWKVIARPRLSRSSTYSVALPAHGEFGFRAVFPGDARNMRSASPELTAHSAY